MEKIIRLTIGLASLGAGVFGLYTITHIAKEIAEKNQPIVAYILISSIVMVGFGAFLLTEPVLQEKIQTKLGQA